jgi:hypothetical protein
MHFVVWLCGGGASSIRVFFQHNDGTDGAAIGNLQHYFIAVT